MTWLVFAQTLKKVAGGLNSTLGASPPKQRNAVKLDGKKNPTKPDPKKGDDKRKEDAIPQSPKLGFFGKRREEAQKKKGAK